MSNFIQKAQHKALKKQFLKTMDNNQGNDFMAHARIRDLASGMTDSQILSAYDSAKKHAHKKNSKKNGIGDTKDPYKNVNSYSAHAAGANALQANNWMNFYPAVPPGLWGLFHGIGGY